MTAAPEHSDLHDLVDRLSPSQADAVRAVLLQLVAPQHDATTSPSQPRKLAFIAAGASSTGITPRIDALLSEGFGRD
ncbi:hypothetical protein [Tsukamurella soli]|uniref:Uncharacterized protein n=1 Tax=Tsukamurella soli TaxID=644556 RepID=A0ABP8KAZ0_9ACTN